MTHSLVVNVKTEACDVYVGRGTKWGNPFSLGPRIENVDSYEHYAKMNSQMVNDIKRELRGKILGCHCAPKRCHADILAEIANES